MAQYRPIKLQSVNIVKMNVCLYIYSIKNKLITLILTILSIWITKNLTLFHHFFTKWNKLVLFLDHIDHLKYESVNLNDEIFKIDFLLQLQDSLSKTLCNTSGF